MSFSEVQCDKMKIPIAFANLKVNNWCTFDNLVIIAGEITHFDSPSVARGTLCKTFQKIAVAHSNNLPMALYCNKCKEFLQKKKDLFDSLYRRKCKQVSLIKDSEELGYTNALKQTLLGLKKRSEELDTELDSL